MKAIAEDAGDKDHMDLEAPKLIRYMYATDNHKYLVDRCLTPDQGVTHDVFKEQDEQVPLEEEEGGEEVVHQGVKENDILNTFKHVYVPEVVREPRIFFHKVPKLGAYMAVPLCYKSCLFDSALD